MILVLIIIIAIIGVQVYYFTKNLARMRQFGSIFANPSSWSLRRNEETNLVIGVQGSGNTIFTSIINSINKYLGNNVGSVIDFGLLKDAVDSHCDSTENDIASLTPIPLYLGLVGTMAGVIVGLWDLLSSNAILTLMGSGAGNIDLTAQQAAKGIDSLLSGIALAMLASICGIVLTTINSLLFKKSKLAEDNGKNSFIAWMQSKLLPELPSDTSEAFNNFVKNLDRFNATFTENTSALGDALGAVNQSFDVQARIIQQVHDMDVMQMAKANVKVLKELSVCTEKLEVFNQYLNDIEGYTAAIHRFETLFNEEIHKLDVLKEIKDFFYNYKGSIARTAVDADNTLKNALSRITSSTDKGIKSLNAQFINQQQVFKEILQEEKAGIAQFTKDINREMHEQMGQLPQFAKQLNALPEQLEKLMDKIEKSNSNLVRSFSQALVNANNAGVQSDDSEGVVQVKGSSTPKWMLVSGWIALVVIAIGCVFFMVRSFLHWDDRTNISHIENITETTQESKPETETLKEPFQLHEETPTSDNPQPVSPNDQQ